MESFKFLHIKLYYNQALIILNIALKKNTLYAQISRYKETNLSRFLLILTWPEFVLHPAEERQRILSEV